MSLPSQRGSSGGTGVTSDYRHGRKRRGGRPPMLLTIVVLLAFVTIAAWGVIYWVGSKRGATGGTEAAKQPADTGNDLLAEKTYQDPGSSDPALSAILGGVSEPEPQTDRPVAAVEQREPSDGMLSGALANAERSLPAVHGEPAEEIMTTGPSLVAGPNPETETTPSVRTPIETSPPPRATVAPADGALAQGERLIAAEKWIDARAVLSDALKRKGLDSREAGRLRAKLGQINEVLVFSDRILPGDAMSSEYRIKGGDSLAKIARRQELALHWKFIARINGISNPARIREGQRLKLVRGPFHAIIDKSDYRLDLYHGAPDAPSSWTFIRSFTVGLGEDDGTPVGSFVVSSNKLENPGWTNPRDGRERYAPNDPKNPIGKFWIGLDGLGGDAKHVGYGLHGTIDPDSIGQSRSMGCVRLGDADIAVVYEMLEERVSVVHIVE